MRKKRIKKIKKKNTQKRQEIISGYSKLEGYKIIIHNWSAFLYTNNKQAEFEINIK